VVDIEAHAVVHDLRAEAVDDVANGNDGSHFLGSSN
jgi:hypothetical protein